MTRREELAEKILLALLHSDAETDGPHADVAMAFALVDAFLAACGEAKEREPDAVWVVERAAQIGRHLFITDGATTHHIPSSLPFCDALFRLLAGRDRVKLAVRVVEDDQ